MKADPNRRRIKDQESGREMGDGRRVGVAVDFSACGNQALNWAVNNAVRDGDTLILVTIQPEKGYERGEMQLWQTTGSPLIRVNEFSDPTIIKKYGVTPAAATLDIVKNVDREKIKIDIVMKIYWGDAREKLCEAIDSIPLDFLVIGNRGLGKIQRTLMGSVSNFMVNHATCPVTVVKSERHN